MNWDHSARCVKVSSRLRLFFSQTTSGYKILRRGGAGWKWNKKSIERKNKNIRSNNRVSVCNLRRRHNYNYMYTVTHLTYITITITCHWIENLSITNAITLADSD